MSEPDMELPAAGWLERDCLAAGSDPEERLVMRITLVRSSFNEFF